MELFRRRVLSNGEVINGHGMFEQRVVKYPALECDDSSARCPQFAGRVAMLLSALCCGGRTGLYVDKVFPYFKKMYREYSEWPKKRQNKLLETFKREAQQHLQRMGARQRDVDKLRKF